MGWIWTLFIVSTGCSAGMALYWIRNRTVATHLGVTLDVIAFAFLITIAIGSLIQIVV